MIAAEQGNLEIVKELIKNGANCNLEDLVYIEIIYSFVFFFSLTLLLRNDSKVIDYRLYFFCFSTLPNNMLTQFFKRGNNRREIFTFSESSQRSRFFMYRWHWLNREHIYLKLNACLEDMYESYC